MVQLAREITIHIDRSERVKALKRLVRFGEERVRTRGRAAHGPATTVVDNERGSE